MLLASSIAPSIGPSFALKKSSNLWTSMYQMLQIGGIVGRFTGELVSLSRNVLLLLPTFFSLKLLSASRHDCLLITSCKGFTGCPGLPIVSSPGLFSDKVFSIQESLALHSESRTPIASRILHIYGSDDLILPLRLEAASLSHSSRVLGASSIRHCVPARTVCAILLKDRD